MLSLRQKRVPGIVGISTYVDYAYQKELQLCALREAGGQGPIHQLRTACVTLDFNLLVENLRAGKRDAAEEQVTRTVEALAAAGADFIVVTSGTTSTLAGPAKKQVSLPFLDLGQAAWGEVPKAAGAVGILATGYAARGGIFQAPGRSIVVPSEGLQREVDEAIFGELVRGEVSARVLRVLGSAIGDLEKQGAAAVILGNTDMTLAAEELAKAATVPLVDSALAHARAAARAALGGTLR